MTTNASPFKRLYDGIALFALLNLLVVGGLGAFLIFTGGVDGDMVRRVAAALRKEEPADEAGSEAESSEDAEAVAAPAAAEDVIAVSQRDLEILRGEAERIRAELDQRLALNNTIMLRVTTEREAFQGRQKERSDRQSAADGQRRAQAFQRQVEMYEGLSPGLAVQHLFHLEDPDEAARLLVAMDARRANKIVEAAKTPDRIKKMQDILKRMGEVEPDPSASTGGGA